MKIAHSPFDIGLSTDSKVLIVMPHPDDESIFAGGFIYELNTHGIPNKLVTLTRGDASTDRHGLDETVDLADWRSSELSRALIVLGGTSHTLYSIPDGKIPAARSRVRSIIQKEIASYKPTHIMTLEPDGIYGHPDHIALSAFVTEVTPGTCRLLYVTVSPSFKPRPESAKMAKKAVIRPVTPDFEFILPLRASIAKIRALRAHSSQFRIDLIHWKTLLRLHRNRLVWREYFTYST